MLQNLVLSTSNTSWIQFVLVVTVHHEHKYYCAVVVVYYITILCGPSVTQVFSVEEAKPQLL